MEIVHINYKEDFKLLLPLGEDYHGEDFRLSFTAGQATFNRFVCSYENGVYTHCEKVDENHVLCLLDNHRLPVGLLSCEKTIVYIDPQMPDGNYKKTEKRLATAKVNGKFCHIELVQYASDPICTAEIIFELLGTVLKGDKGEDAFGVSLTPGSIQVPVDRDWKAKFVGGTVVGQFSVSSSKGDKHYPLAVDSIHSEPASAPFFNLSVVGSAEDLTQLRLSIDDSWDFPIFNTPITYFVECNKGNGERVTLLLDVIPVMDGEKGADAFGESINPGVIEIPVDREWHVKNVGAKMGDISVQSNCGGKHSPLALVDIQVSSDVPFLNLTAVGSQTDLTQMILVVNGSEDAPVLREVVTFTVTCARVNGEQVVFSLNVIPIMEGLPGAPGQDGTDGKDGKDGGILYPNYRIDPINMHLYSDVDNNRISVSKDKHFNVTF